SPRRSPPSWPGRCGTRRGRRTRARPWPRFRTRCRRSARRPPSIQLPAHALRALAAAQLLLGAALDLADALARDAQGVTDLLQGARLLAVEAEAHLDDLALLVVQLGHHGPDLLLGGGAYHLQLHRGDGVLLQRVAQLQAAVLAHRARQREVLARHLQ